MILHLGDKAREGRTLLRNAEMKQRGKLIEAGEAAGSSRVFSVRHEFPAEWHRFKTQNGQPHELALTRKAEHYPFWAQGRLKGASVTRVDLLVRYEQNPIPVSIEVAYKAANRSDGTREGTLDLEKKPSLGNLLVGQVTNAQLKPVGLLTLYFDDTKLSDLWIAVTWSA